MPALFFLCSILEIFYYFKYKHFLFLFRVFSNCFISPNFIWRGYNIMRSLAVGEAFVTFILPGTKFTQMPNFLVQRSVLARLSRGHMKQGYLVYPPCWPKKKNAKRNMRQLWSVYVFYFECAMDKQHILFPLYKSTHSRMQSDESLNKRQSLGS